MNFGPKAYFFQRNILHTYGSVLFLSTFSLIVILILPQEIQLVMYIINEVI
jgi:hypothetical protein